MGKKNGWNLFLQLLALASCLLLAIGFVLSLNNILRPPTTTAATKEVSSQPTPEPKQQSLVALGDSLTRGIGDEEGLGYIGIVQQQLTKQKQTVQLSNLAISGQTSPELLQQLKQIQVQQTLAKAKWITLTIGGNDLKNSVENFTTLNTTKAAKNEKAYAQNLQQILTQIRTHNKTAPIFLFSLYDPYSDLGDRELTSKTVLAWNQTMQNTASKTSNVIIIPTFDLFQLNPGKYLSSDHFHPNHQGYQRFAARLLQVMQDTGVKNNG
jgi:lysophospholipase L1-like esterase